MDAPMPMEIRREWDRFTPETTRRDRLICPEIFKNGWLFPLQRQFETVEMMVLARNIGAKTIMEIGSDKGGGFFHWPACVPTVTKAVAVELRGVPFDRRLPELFPEVRFCMNAGSSRAQSVVDNVVNFLAGDKIDVLFIDGEKSMVEGDFNLWAPRVRPGGAVLIHDIVDDIEPSRFFYSLRSKYKLGCIIDGREALGIDAKQNLTAWEHWLKIWKANSCGVGIVYV